MRVLQTDIPGIGPCELREPLLKTVRPFLGLIGTDTQEFMINILNVCVYQGDQHIANVDNVIGLSALQSLMPLLSELLGFDEEPEGDEGND
ncbi:hypothetical protein DRH27_00535 [Candidatus Falkowbacteria bacterium]|nr:MAG: hypothetical protein DRH27_00535 [Candidatus Falkowbacteria bacterium]